MSINSKANNNLFMSSVPKHYHLHPSNTKIQSVAKNSFNGSSSRLSNVKFYGNPPAKLKHVKYSIRSDKKYIRSKWCFGILVGLFVLMLLAVIIISLVV